MWIYCSLASADDFSIGGGTNELSVGAQPITPATMICTGVTAADDDPYEGVESLTVSLASTEPSIPIAAGQSRTIDIVDPEGDESSMLYDTST